MDKRIEAVDQKVENLTIYMENVINKKLELLIEGQHTLLETLAPKSRVEALEEEVIFLKQVIRGMAQDIAELKKAQ